MQRRVCWHLHQERFPDSPQEERWIDRHLPKSLPAPRASDSQIQKSPVDLKLRVDPRSFPPPKLGTVSGKVWCRIVSDSTHPQNLSVP